MVRLMPHSIEQVLHRGHQNPSLELLFDDIAYCNDFNFQDLKMENIDQLFLVALGWAAFALLIGVHSWCLLLVFTLGVYSWCSMVCNKWSVFFSPARRVSGPSGAELKRFQPGEGAWPCRPCRPCVYNVSIFVISVSHESHIITYQCHISCPYLS